MLKYIAPVARLKVCGYGYGLFEHTVSVQVENDASGTGIIVVVVILPEFLYGNVYISVDISVGYVIAFNGGLVTVNDFFLDGICDLTACAVVLRQICETPTPVSVIIRVYGEFLDLGGTFHQIDRDVIRTDDLCNVFVSDPFFVAFDVDDCGSVGEGYRRIFAIFNGLGTGAQSERRDRVVSGGGTDRLVGNERE